MNFSVLPPEVNSARMYVGAGSGPMLAAAAAWDGLAGELSSAADSFGSLTSGLADGPWQGAASAAMTSVAARYVGFLNTAATQADGAATRRKRQPARSRRRGEPRCIRRWCRQTARTLCRW